MGNIISNKVAAEEPIHRPVNRARLKRKSSALEDFEDIVQAFKGVHAWKKSTIINFVLFFIVMTGLTGTLFAVANASKEFDIWSFLLLAFVSNLFSVFTFYVCNRALVIKATNRASYLKSSKSEFTFIRGKAYLKNTTLLG